MFDLCTEGTYMIKITENYRKQVKKIDIIHVKQYLERIGWSTVYFNTPSGDRLISKLALEDTAKRTDGFVYKAGALQYVFINAGLCEQDKLVTLIHESAHIFLHHDFTAITKNDEAEAWHFTYNVTHRKGKIIRFVIQLILCITILGAVIAAASNAETATGKAAYVYVTSAGQKYHSAECRYVSGKYCIKMRSDEAANRYSPCSVCNCR